MNEIEALESLHRAAQARLGFAIALMSSRRWEKVQATSPDKSGSQWADDVAAAVVEAQEVSADLARTYYQLARAIEIGATMGEPINAGAFNLGSYRDSFISQILHVSLLGEDNERTPLHGLIEPHESLELLDLTPNVQRFLDTMDESQDTKAIVVEPYAWPTYRDDEDFVADQIYSKAVAPLSKQLKEIRKDEEAADPIGAVEEAFRTKGSLGSGNADELSMRAGRTILERAHFRDRKVLKYARGTGANPCHFCAMLASRGFVYASDSTATDTYRNGGLRSYHPSCHCFPIARWVDASPLPSLNQEFQDLWKKEIANKYSGKAAIRQWRRVIAKRQKTVTRSPIETD